jgi:hemerythrin-like domain-containing protein
MDCIDLMKAEHANILELLGVMRSACCRILEGAPVADADFRDMIWLVRNYADKHHHGKEEQILFVEMVAHQGQIAENLIQHGMLVEHDLGRLYISNLEAALDRYAASPTAMNKLDILANAVSYTDLLQRHIEKEDAAVYAFAERELPKDVMESVAEHMRQFEAESEARNFQSKCLDLLAQLKEKYRVLN